MNFIELASNFSKSAFTSEVNKRINSLTDCQSAAGNVWKECFQKGYNIGKEYTTVTEAFDKPMSDAKETTLKKIFAAATIAAKHTGILPQELQSVPVEVMTGAIDETVTRAKVAYQLGTGQLNPLKAFEALADRTAARLIGTASQWISIKGVEMALNKMVLAVSSVYPPAATLTLCVPTIAHFVGNKIQPAVVKGMNTLYSGAKYITKNAVRIVANKTRTAFSMAARFAGKAIGKIL